MNVLRFYSITSDPKHYYKTKIRINFTFGMVLLKNQIDSGRNLVAGI